LRYVVFGSYSVLQYGVLLPVSFWSVVVHIFRQAYFLRFLKYLRLPVRNCIAEFE
jgi:hypothetical protein